MWKSLIIFFICLEMGCTTNNPPQSPLYPPSYPQNLPNIPNAQNSPNQPNPTAYSSSSNSTGLASSVGQSPSGSLFNGQEDLYTNVTAHKPGDTLTVVIRETHSVQEDDDVKFSKKSDFKTSADIEPKSLISSLPFVSSSIGKLEGSRESNQEGTVKYNKKSDISDKLPVVVTEVRPDGLLVIWGKRQIKVNSEFKTLALSGLVSPKDVTSDNTILSERVALASIHIEGKGTWTATTEPGFASKVFQSLIDMVWPF